MKKAHKLVSAVLVSTMVLSMTACGSGEKTYKVGILQQLEHPALDQATQGFQDALTKLMGDSVTFDVQNAQGEQANCSSIATTFVSNNYDLILANATTALQASAAATSTIPVLGTSVTDYATALDIDDWTGATGKNISGTSDLAPLDQQSHARGCIRVLLAGCRFQGSSGLIKLRTGILPGELHAAAGIENPQVKVVYLSLLAFRQARTCLGPVGCRTHADVYRRGHAFRDTAAPKQLLVRTAGKNGQ